MQSLLTGSRVYGEPRPDSDLDMVLLIENLEDEFILQGMQSPRKPSMNTWNSKGPYNGHSLRYDRLNIIAVRDKEIYSAWQKGTDFLKSIKPVTHEQACAVFETMFNIAQQVNRKKLTQGVIPF